MKHYINKEKLERAYKNVNVGGRKHAGAIKGTLGFILSCLESEEEVSIHSPSTKSLKEELVDFCPHGFEDGCDVCDKECEQCKAPHANQKEIEMYGCWSCGKNHTQKPSKEGKYECSCSDVCGKCGTDHGYCCVNPTQKPSKKRFDELLDKGSDVQESPSKHEESQAIKHAMNRINDKPSKIEECCNPFSSNPDDYCCEHKGAVMSARIKQLEEKLNILEQQNRFLKGNRDGYKERTRRFRKALEHIAKPKLKSVDSRTEMLHDKAVAQKALDDD